MRRSPWQRALRYALSPLYKRLETSVHPLRYLFLEITCRCNLACRHCGSDCDSSARTGELTTDEWVRLIESLPDAFPSPRPFVVVTGGEPLCHPELLHILGAIRRCGLRCGLVTNGWQLDAEWVDAFVELGVESVTVSLDGTVQTHEWLRGRKGAFDRAISGIRLLTKSAIPVVDVVTCVHPGNLDELVEVEGILRQAGVKRWRLFSIFPKGRAKHDPQLILSPGQIRQLLEWIALRRKLHEQSDFAMGFCCEGYLPSDMDRRVRDEPYFCRAGINIGSVLSDGTISACPNIAPSLAQGNVREHKLREVWDGGFGQFRERSWMRKGPCEACSEWSKCLGNSMHLWDEERGHTCLCHAAAVRSR